MHKTRLIQILKTFSTEEIKEFDKFISSPYFGCRQFIINFFKLLKKYHPLFNEDDIKKEKLYFELYGDKKYNDGLMRRIISEINKYTEEFLMLKRLYKTSVFRNNCLLMELRDRNLGNLFESKAENVLKKLSREKEVNFYSLLDKHLTEIEIYSNMSQHHDKGKFNQLDKAVESLIAFFLNTYLSTSNNLVISGFNINSEITKSFIKSFDLKQFFEILDKTDSNPANLIKAIHYSIRIIFDKTDTVSYNKLKNTLNTGCEYFSTQQKMLFYSKLFRFYDHYNLINDETYLEEEFHDYKTVLNEKLFLIPYPYMGVYLCRNYFSACTRLLKVTEINSFIKNYSQYFDQVYKDDLINYGRSIEAFEKKQFERSLELISKTKFALPLFKNDQKILKLKCFYELDNTEPFYFELDSYKHFLRNSVSLDKDVLESGQNFSSSILKLKKNKDSDNKDKIYLVEKEIKKLSLISEKKWLLQKAGDRLKPGRRKLL